MQKKTIINLFESLRSNELQMELKFEKGEHLSVLQATHFVRVVLSKKTL